MWNSIRLSQSQYIRFSSALPSIVRIYEVDYPGWNHNDFVYAIDAKKFVYNEIIDKIKNITSNSTDENSTNMK